MTTSTEHQVKLFIEEHDRDGLLYMDCPTCNKPNKLMVGPADEGGHWYKCLSAGCRTWGTTGGTGYKPVPASEPTTSSRTLYPKYQADTTYVPATEVGRKQLSKRYGIGKTHTQLLSPGKAGLANLTRLVFPVYTPNMSERGYVLRKQYSVDPDPKTLLRAYYQLPDPMISWYWPTLGNRDMTGGVICLVEDQISAARLGQYLPTVAMLGTSLGPAAVNEIRKEQERLHIRRVCVVLDNDACMQAQPLAHKFTNGVPVPLFSEDIKDMPSSNLKQLVDVLYGR